MNSHTYNTQPRWRAPDQTIATGLPKRHSQPAFLAILVSLFISLTLSGCVALTSAGKPGKTSPNGATYGTLAASATSFTFGNVAVGSKSSQTLTLTNTGRAAIKISQATISGLGFSTAVGMSSVSIEPGHSHMFHIQFAPQAAGNHSGSLVVASDASDSALSVSLNGTGMTGLSITTQPVSQSVTAGQTATFDATATGSGTLTYQWKKNGATIGGATFSTYSTPVTTASDNSTSFMVVVSDSTNTVTSNPATLTVTAAPVAPTITMHPASQTIVAGQSAAFAVAATGTATLAYQWKRNGAAISGANSSTFIFPGTTASDNGALFNVTVSNSKGNITSNVATLTVNALPAKTTQPIITAQPAGQDVTAGQTATFNVGATAAPLNYQWTKNGTPINGANLASYTTPVTTMADNGASFTVTVSNAAGSITSNTAALAVTTASVAPSITVQPVSHTIIAGQTTTFAVSAAGTATLAYQWKKSGIAINGATSASYTPPAATISDNGSVYTVTVSNSKGNITSNIATLTVSTATSLLKTSTTALNFASVNISGTSSLGVTFTNAGNSDVTVSNVSIAGPGFAASGISTGEILTPGQSATLNVTFTPATAGTGTGSATVASNAANSPTTITLSGIGVQAVSHSATFTWSASSPAVTGYNIYRSAVSGGPYTKLNSAPITMTRYIDSTVLPGKTYFDVITSVDSSNAESKFSNEVSATIPTN